MGCRSGCERSSPSSAPIVSTTPAGQLTPPETLFELGKSAYHTRLELAPDAVYLLTMEGAYRLGQGEEPRKIELDLGELGVATPSAFVFWSNGSLWLAPKQGGPAGRLAPVKTRPIFIVSVGERFAWIGPDTAGHHTVYTLRGGIPHVVHAASGQVAAATMVEDRVVFVERPDAATWRLGSVSTGGGPAVFGAIRNGRYPAALAAAGEVYYYVFDDKKMSEVRAVSPDLQIERVVAKDAICSPLAVADRVFCAHMEGIFELSPSSGLSKLVYPAVVGSITTLAVDPNRIVWVSDVGAEKLVVMMLPRAPRDP